MGIWRGAGRQSLPDGQMLVQLGAVFFTYHAAERSAYSITTDIYSHVAMEQQRVAAERLSEVFSVVNGVTAVVTAVESSRPAAYSRTACH